MFEAGQVQAVLGGQFNPRGFMQFDAAMKKSGANAAAFEKSAVTSANRTQRATGSMAATVGKVGAGAFVVAAIGAGKAVNAYRDYDKQMQSVRAVSKASEREIAALEKTTKKIGVTTKYSATEAAGASVELVKAGMSIQQVIGGGLTSALSLAAAGDLELADAATYTANAMNAFNIEAKDAGTIADALATAANDTTADVGDFGMALTQGGSAAKTAGLEFKDTMVILEALAKIGIKNSDAGTSLKASLVQLLSPTKKQAELQKELGLSFVGQNGKMRDAAAISRDLRKATAEMTDAERLATFEKLAGTDGLRTLSALYQAGPKTLDGYSKSLSKAGEAARVAAAKQKGLSGSVDRAKAAFSTMMVEIGGKLAPMVDSAVQKVTGFITQSMNDGSIERWAGQAASAAKGFGEVAINVGKVGAAAASAASPITHMLGSLNNSMPKGSQVSILSGLVTGFLAFRGMNALAPGVERMGGAIRSATAAGRGANLAQDIASSFAAAGMMAQRTDKDFTGLRAKTAGVRAGMGSMLGGLGAVAGGLGPVGWAAIAAGAGFALYTYSQQSAADASREAAEAIAAGGQAAQTAGDQYVTAAGKQLEAEQTAIRLSELKKQRAAAEKEGNTALVKSVNNQIKQGDLLIEQQKKGAKAAVNEAPKITAKQLGDTLREVNQRQKDVNSAQQDYTRSLTSPGAATAAGKARTATLKDELAASQRVYEAAKRRESQMRAMRRIDDINQQRARRGVSPISMTDAQGAVHLREALKGVPKSVRTRILLEGSSKSIGQLGQLMAGFKGIPNEKRAKAILEGDGSVKSKIAALTALAISDKDFNISATDLASKVIAQIRMQQIADKFFSIFGINRGTKGEARGGGGSARVAMVGEGSNPNETVINRRTGEGFVTSGPMLMSLSADDYVIPHDSRYRGRALGLFQSLAADLGIEGYEGGKKPKLSSDFPKLSKKYRRAALTTPLEDLQADYERIKGKPKGKRKGLMEARGKYLAAKKFADKISAQEDLVELAENDITLGHKTGNAATYNKGVAGRKAALDKLIRWFGDALKFNPKGAWGRELKKKLGEKQIALQDAVGGDYLTAAESTSLDQLETDAATAELTDTLTDDQTALGGIAALRQQVYDRVKNSGAPNSVIKDAAQALKSARDNVAGLTSASVTPDMQAQLDQANERNRVSGENARIANQALAAFGSSGDIASGGRNAYAAAGGGVNVTVNTLHPGDPQTLSAIAGATTAGISAQGYVPSSRVKTGL